MCEHNKHDSVSKIKKELIKYLIICEDCRKELKLIGSEKYIPSPDLTHYTSQEHYEKQQLL